MLFGSFQKLTVGRSARRSAGTAWLVLIAGTVIPHSSFAQVLRIGGFDFNSKARLEGVYTTNVQRERPGITSASAEDYYVLAGLDLTGSRPVGQSTTLDLATGISEEHHFKRSDLDNSSNPFGHFNVRSSSEIGHLEVHAEANYDRNSQSQTDAFSPNGKGKARDPQDKILYGVGANYEVNRLSIGGDYTYSSTAHDLKEFQLQDQQEDRHAFFAGYKLAERLTPRYTYDWSNTKYPNNPESSRTQVTHRFMFPFMLMQEPNLTYTFTWQKEDKGDGNPVKWEPVNNISLADNRKLSESLAFSYFINYQNKQDPAQDDVQLTYGAALNHSISRTATETFTASRQPVNTLGSTLKTEMTMYRYFFTKSDLIIYDLNLGAGAGYEISVPYGDKTAPEQKTLRYDASLDYRKAITPRLNRSLSYAYSYENIDIQPPALVEHRVTLSYDYTF